MSHGRLFGPRLVAVVRQLGFAAPLIALALAAGATPASAKGPHTKLYKEPGAMELTGISCQPAGGCVAIGLHRGGNQQGVILPIDNGVPGTIEKETSFSFTTGGVACPVKHTCIIVGNGSAASDPSSAVVVFVKNGVVQQRLKIKHTILHDIACGGPKYCWATGATFFNGGFVPAVVQVYTGIAVTLQRETNFPAGSALNAISCPDQNDCTIAGFEEPNLKPEGAFFRIDHGLLSGDATVTGTSVISNVSCAGSRCLLVGHGNINGVIADTDKGDLHQIHFIRKTATMQGVACDKHFSCDAFGQSSSAFYEVPVTAGKPGTPRKIGAGIVSAACNDSGCFGVGSALDPALFGTVGYVFRY